MNNTLGYVELEAIGGGEVWFSGKESQVELIISKILEMYTMKVESIYQCNETILPMSIIGILTPNKERAEWAERIQGQVPASSQTPVFYEQFGKTLLLPKKGYDLPETTAPLLREYLDKKKEERRKLVSE